MYYNQCSIISKRINFTKAAQVCYSLVVTVAFALHWLHPWICSFTALVVTASPFLCLGHTFLPSIIFHVSFKKSLRNNSDKDWDNWSPWIYSPYCYFCHVFQPTLKTLTPGRAGTCFLKSLIASEISTTTTESLSSASLGITQEGEIICVNKHHFHILMWQWCHFLFKTYQSLSHTAFLYHIC